MALTPQQIEAMNQATGLSKPVTPEAKTAKTRADEIRSLVKNQPQKNPNYFERVGEGYAKAGQDIVSGIQKSAEDIQKGDVIKGVARAGLRTVGGVARAAFEPIVEAPVIKQGLEKVAETVATIPQAQEVIKKVTDLAQRYPELAKDAQDIVDTLSLGVGKTVTKPAQEIAGEALTKVGGAIEKSGIKAAESTKDKFLQELVRPVQTKAVKEAQVARTTEKGFGIFKKSEITPEAYEQKAIEELKTVKGVDEKNTFQQNYNAIASENAIEAGNLVGKIKTNDFIIPRKESISRVKEAKQALEESPVIVGDAQKTADKLLNGAIKFIESNDGTGSGLLKARKEFDQWVLSQKPKAFDATAENAFTVSNREIRNAFNTLLDEKAPNLEIKKSLSRQSALYDAMENIVPKAAEEANTAIGRAFQNMMNVVGVKNKLVQQIATIVGIGGLGAAATFAPVAATTLGAGFLLYKGGKFILKPEVREGLGKLLKTSGKLLNPEDKKILEDALKMYNENPEGGFVSLGADVGKSNPLLQEAKKYKSAEDFVNKMQGSATQYGDYTPNARLAGLDGYENITKLGVKPDETITIYRGIDDIKGNLPRKINDGDFVTTDFDSALSYAGRKEDVVSMKVKAKDLYVSEPKDFKAEPFYIGSEYVYTTKGGSPLTKSQLTDIWKQAQGKK